MQAAEQEVDVERALMRLVDDHRVVAAQERIAADLGEQQTVRDQADQGVLGAAVVEADRVADGAAERHVELVGDPLRHGARREPSRLGVGDGPPHTTPELEAELGQLRRLARAGLPGHHDDLVILDRRQQVVATRGDRQLRRIGDLGDRRAPSLHPGPRLAQAAAQTAPGPPRCPDGAGEPGGEGAARRAASAREAPSLRRAASTAAPSRTAAGGVAGGGHPDRE